jgi:hypothetical protein
VSVIELVRLICSARFVLLNASMIAITRCIATAAHVAGYFISFTISLSSVYHMHVLHTHAHFSFCQQKAAVATAMAMAIMGCIYAAIAIPQ